MPDMTRAQHLAWCKQRALAELDRGDLAGAVASMASDMRKHPETASAALFPLVSAAMADVAVGDAAAIRRWIEGFN